MKVCGESWTTLSRDDPKKGKKLVVQRTMFTDKGREERCLPLLPKAILFAENTWGNNPGDLLENYQLWSCEGPHRVNPDSNGSARERKGRWILQ